VRTGPVISRRVPLAIIVGAAVFALGVPAALADPPATPSRADAYYEVLCFAPGATEEAAYERVDAHFVEVGNKDEQVAHYGDHHPGWTCRVAPGP
jgi:hypothetical protein